MTPKEAIILHLESLFPIMNGITIGPVFLWKFVAFFLCLTLAWRNPIRYFWSTLFTLCMLPVMLAFGATDPVSFVVHLYLLWMCAEVSCQSVAVADEKRLVGWWVIPLFLVFCL